MVPHWQGSLLSGQPGHQLTSSFALQELHPWGGGLLLLLAQAYAYGGEIRFLFCVYWMYYAGSWRTGLLTSALLLQVHGPQ